MEIRHNIAVTEPILESLRQHCDKKGELMYRCVARFITDGIAKDNKEGRG